MGTSNYFIMAIRNVERFDVVGWVNAWSWDMGHFELELQVFFTCHRFVKENNMAIHQHNKFTWLYKHSNISYPLTHWIKSCSYDEFTSWNSLICRSIWYIRYKLFKMAISNLLKTSSFSPSEGTNLTRVISPSKGPVWIILNFVYK